MISILIPVYNEKESLNTLHAEIEEARRSASLELEAIFIDDGSTDGTDEIVLSFAHRNVRLLRFEPGSGTTDTLRGIGVLQIAGVEREVSLDVTTQQEGSTLKVQGRVRLLMTDFGIKPPTAMLGMLKTDPKVGIAFETVLAVPRT